MNKALLLITISVFILLVIGISSTYLIFYIIGPTGLVVSFLFAIASVVVGIFQIKDKKGKRIYNIIAIALGLLVMVFFIWLYIGITHLV
jgi:hypothetical protein